YRNLRMNQDSLFSGGLLSLYHLLSPNEALENEIKLALNDVKKLLCLKIDSANNIVHFSPQALELKNFESKTTTPKILAARRIIREVSLPPLLNHSLTTSSKEKLTD